MTFVELNKSMNFDRKHFSAFDFRFVFGKIVILVVILLMLAIPKKLPPHYVVYSKHIEIHG